MQAMKERRIGRFQVPLRYIDSWPEDVMAVLADCLIVRAENLYHANAIEYVGYSDRFEPTEEFTEPPTYIADIEQTVDQETGDINRRIVGWRKLEND